MPRPFLSARWANLAIISYAVPPAMLAPYLPASPAGTTLEVDTRDDLAPGGGGGVGGGGRTPHAFVSLVALQFQHCRVLGIPWPGHTDFPEINLRFYVRTAGGGPASGLRGVVFIREFVPRPLIAWAAKRFYNEPYLAAPVTSRITQTASTISAEYTLTHGAASPATRGGGGGGQIDAQRQSGGGVPSALNTLRISGRKPVIRPGPHSVEHWFKEHSWGFGMRPPQPGRSARPLVYEVIHPAWGIYPVESCHVQFDFAAVYGPDWGFLSGSTPASVVFAAGSEVAVFPPREEMGVRWGVRR